VLSFFTLNEAISVALAIGILPEVAVDTPGGIETVRTENLIGKGNVRMKKSSWCAKKGFGDKIQIASAESIHHN
jgi:hypothetical protein